MAAPFVITTPGLLMPVRQVWAPREFIRPLPYVGPFLPAIWSEKLLHEFLKDATMRQVVLLDEFCSTSQFVKVRIGPIT